MPIFPEILIAAANLARWRDTTAAFAAALAAGSMLLGLWNYRSALAQTTLSSAAWWAAAATLSIAAVELASAAFAWDIRWIAPLQFCAAALSFCPFVAVLGAKRPQHLAWNFVVFSLWGIVSLSALTALVMQRSDHFVLGDARAWLLWVLILMGLVNYLPTRKWPVAVLVAIGQIVLFASHLPLLRGTGVATLPGAPSLALVTFAAATALVGWASEPVRIASSNSSAKFDRLWFDFRDLYGLLWGLRLQERVNAASTAAKWSLELNWSGFRPAEIPPQHRDALRLAMTGLLRRFVSHEWIAARLEKGIDLHFPLPLGEGQGEGSAKE